MDTHSFQLHHCVYLLDGNLRFHIDHDLPCGARAMGPVGHCQIAVEVFSWTEDRERERTREEDSVGEKLRAQARSYRIHAGVMRDHLSQRRRVEEMSTDPYGMI